MSYFVPKEIPSNCRECPCGYETEGAFRDECQVLAREWEKDADSVRPNWCPLVEIKTPHGRLIDADKLNTYDLSPVNGFCVIGVTEEDIGLAETILEAEGSEE